MSEIEKEEFRKRDMKKKNQEKLLSLQFQLEAANDEIASLNAEISRLTVQKILDQNNTKKEKKKTRKNPKYCSDLAFDWWPPRDWLRFSITKWAPGQYFQICLGPLRFEFFAT
jgi:hypothetical protein